MATTKLSSIDFMMMDVHRELDEETVDQQTMVDKTEHAPSEEPDERCHICFAPMPCEAHANVDQLYVTTKHDLDPTTIIAEAHNAGLKEVVVVGQRHDGSEYFASSVADGAATMYHLQRGIYKLNKIIDGEDENEHLGPPPAA